MKLSTSGWDFHKYLSVLGAQVPLKVIKLCAPKSLGTCGKSHTWVFQEKCSSGMLRFLCTAVQVDINLIGLVKPLALGIFFSPLTIPFLSQKGPLFWKIITKLIIENWKLDPSLQRKGSEVCISLLTRWAILLVSTRFLLEIMFDYRAWNVIHPSPSPSHPFLFKFSTEW